LRCDSHQSGCSARWVATVKTKEEVFEGTVLKITVKLGCRTLVIFKGAGLGHTATHSSQFWKADCPKLAGRNCVTCSVGEIEKKTRTLENHKGAVPGRREDNTVSVGTIELLWVVALATT
jgi:hypothetical protein